MALASAASVGDFELVDNDAAGVAVGCHCAGLDDPLRPAPTRSIPSPRSDGAFALGNQGVTPGKGNSEHATNAPIHIMATRRLDQRGERHSQGCDPGHGSLRITASRGLGYGELVRLALLIVGVVVGSTVMVLGAVMTRPSLLLVGALLAVPTSSALNPELRKGRYAGLISRGRRPLAALGEHLRFRGPVVLLGGFGGLIVGGLTLGWWWDAGLPAQCQDLFVPDPPLCTVLAFIRSWLGQFFILVGVVLGWVSRRRSDKPEEEPSTAGAVFDVLGQLVAVAAVMIGAIIIAPVAFDLPGYRQSPWIDLAVGSAAIGGGLLYTIGLRRRAGRRAVVEKAAGWILFTGVLMLPLFTSTYLLRWWLQGALLSAIALPGIWK